MLFPEIIGVYYNNIQGTLLMSGGTYTFTELKTVNPAYDTTCKTKLDNNVFFFNTEFYDHVPMLMGRDSSVGIATRYGRDGPAIESRWGARFSAPVQIGPGPYPASHTMGAGSFSGVKRPGRDVDHPPPSSAEVKVRVWLYLYSRFGPSWPILGKTLLLLMLIISSPTIERKRHSDT